MNWRTVFAIDLVEAEAHVVVELESERVVTVLVDVERCAKNPKENWFHGNPPDEGLIPRYQNEPSIESGPEYCSFDDDVRDVVDDGSGDASY